MNWIDINDRLPEYKEKEQIVIVSGIEYGERYVCYAYVYAYGKDPDLVFTVPGWSKMNVTHWMPLPDPPTEQTT